MTDQLDVNRGELLLLLPKGLRVAGNPLSTIDDACRVVALALYDESNIIDYGDLPDAIEAAFAKAITDAKAFGGEAERDGDILRLRYVVFGFPERLVVPRLIAFKEGTWPKVMRIDWGNVEPYGLMIL